MTGKHWLRYGIVNLYRLDHEKGACRYATYPLSIHD